MRQANVATTQGKHAKHLRASQEAVIIEGKLTTAVPAPSKLRTYVDERAESFGFYEQAAVRFLAKLGTSPDNTLAVTYASDRDRYSAWAADAIVYALRSLRSGNSVAAFRCLLMAREYVGRIGGFWPCSYLSDAATLIQNAVETSLSDAWGTR